MIHPEEKASITSLEKGWARNLSRGRHQRQEDHSLA